MLDIITKKVLENEDIEQCDIDFLLSVKGIDLMELLTAANKIRQNFCGDEIGMCSIINVKSASCSEDCRFCSQSTLYHTGVESYPLLKADDVLKKAFQAEKSGADHFGLVSSGKNIISQEEFNNILALISIIKEKTELEVCASLGILTKERARSLAAAGLKRYNHNLETSERFFHEVCTTHSYQDRLNSLVFLKECGVGLCSGGIIGMGESFQDRIDLVLALKEVEVDSIPINILNPIKGTPFEGKMPISPLEVLKTLAIFRFILPDKTIKLCGGRESNLRDLQSLALFSGINALLIGDYLTTKGRSADEDLQMIKDLGLKVK
ncbi:MAG: biotin synthase BioB [bacterium]